MKKILVKVLAVSALLPSFAEDYLESPIVVTMTSVKQESRTQDVVVNYKLENHPGIVRMDVLTNGVSIGSEYLSTFTGSYSMSEADVINPGSHTIRWRARKDWRGNLATNAVIRLSAYYTNQIYQIPGVYMKVDLDGGQSATSYPVTYTFTGPSTNQYGQANNTADMDRYLWLRRVGSTGPVTYTQGTTTYGSLIDNAGTAETVRSVTLSEGFFAGVFPVTHAQYVRVISKNSSDQSGGDYAPVNNVSYWNVRGSVNDGVNWPNTGHAVAESSFLHAFRERTGLDGFDLPTEAQWEFFCRAGTDSDFNDGSNLSPTNYYIGSTLVANCTYDVHLAQLGWFGNWSDIVGQGNAKTAMTVGQKKPNAWGLYDCHGNVNELCLDLWSDSLTASAVTDPKGPVSSSVNQEHVLRGGSWNYIAAKCRSASRAKANYTKAGNHIGFRLVCTFNDK